MTLSAVFLKVVNMAIAAGWMILAVIAARALLKKAPRWISCALWAMVFVRLVCPFSLKSALSLIPSRETIPAGIEMMAKPAVDSGIAVIDEAVNPLIASSLSPEPSASANPLQILIPILSVLWVIGMMAMLLHALVSYLRLRRSVSASVSVKEGIMACDEVSSPFILGIFRPVIYVPSSMAGEALDLVITHEEAHIRRRDHWWKPLGYLLLAVYWFSPLCWIAYILLCRDIEMACDERVIRGLDDGGKAAYSQALLDCSIPRRRIAACPLAFGEVSVKERVKSVLNYRKPAFWITAAAVIACIVIAACFLTDPVTVTETDKMLSRSMSRAVIEYNTSAHPSSSNYVATDIKVMRVSRSKNTVTVYAWVMYEEYSFDGKTVSLASGSHIPTVMTFDTSGDGGDGSVYDVIEYWIPRDGSYYAKDIRSKFPLTLWGQAFDVSGAEAQSERCRREACENFHAEEFSGGMPTSSDPLVSGQVYGVVEVTYEAPYLDYQMIAQGNTLCFMTEGSHLLMASSKTVETADWRDLGEFSGIAITKENFDDLFQSSDSGWFLNESASLVRKNTDKAWSVICGQDSFYYILLQKNGEIFIASGYYDYLEKGDPHSDDTCIHRLLRIAPAANDAKPYTYNVSYANWSEESVIYQEALNPEKMMISSARHLPVYKIETAAELKAFKNSFSGVLTLDQGYDEVPSFEYITAAYDGSFFSKYALMVAYVTAGSGSYRFGVREVHCDGQSFCMYVEQLNDPETFTDDMAGWFAVVEVPKEEIGGCTEFDAVLENISVAHQSGTSNERVSVETTRGTVLFSDIMGVSGYYEERQQAEGIPFYVRTYFADLGSGVDIIGESFGFEIDDHVADIDGDGVAELLCNCQYGGDGHVELNVFRLNGAVFEVGTARPEDLGLEDFHDWGINSYMTYYDGEKAQMLIEYDSEKDHSKTNVRILTADDLAFRPFTGTAMQ